MMITLCVSNNIFIFLHLILIVPYDVYLYVSKGVGKKRNVFCSSSEKPLYAHPGREEGQIVQYKAKVFDCSKRQGTLCLVVDLG